MGHVLKYGDDCYFAENPATIAYVIMGNICNVWFNAVKCRNNIPLKPAIEKF